VIELLRELGYNSDMATATTGLTYDDLLRIPPDRNRYELVEGELFVSAAPNTEHRLKIGGLFAQLWYFVREHDLGQLLVAPCDVVLDPSIVLEPDIVFVSKARKSIVKKARIEGEPDLVVEAISPSSRPMDRLVKRARYEEFGVPEYWLLEPFEPRLEVLWLEGRNYRVLATFGPGDTLESPTFPGFRLPLASL